MLRRGVWLTWSGCLKYSVLSKRIMEQTMCCILQSYLAFCQHATSHGRHTYRKQTVKSNLIARLIVCSHCCRYAMFREVYRTFLDLRLRQWTVAWSFIFHIAAYFNTKLTCQTSETALPVLLRTFLCCHPSCTSPSWPGTRQNPPCHSLRRYSVFHHTVSKSRL